MKRVYTFMIAAAKYGQTESPAPAGWESMILRIRTFRTVMQLSADRTDAGRYGFHETHQHGGYGDQRFGGSVFRSIVMHFHLQMIFGSY